MRPLHSPKTDHEEYALPCVEALLAGTLALMTGVAQAPCGSARVVPMAAKIAANLDALADHPGLSAPMRQMLTRLLAHWQGAAGAARVDTCRPPERTLWLRSPATVQ